MRYGNISAIQILLWYNKLKNPAAARPPETCLRKAVSFRERAWGEARERNGVKLSKTVCGIELGTAGFYLLFSAVKRGGYGNYGTENMRHTFVMYNADGALRLRR